MICHGPASRSAGGGESRPGVDTSSEACVTRAGIKAFDYSGIANFLSNFKNRRFLKKQGPGLATPSYNARPRGGTAASHGPVFGERSAMQSYECRSVRSWSKEFNWTLAEGRKKYFF